MGRPTKAQVAAREAAKVEKNETVDTQVAKSDTEDIPRETKRTRIDAKEYADKLRKNRPSSSGLEQKMKYYGENPGWKRRWVNDDTVPSRLAEGYRFVQKEEVSMSDSIRYGNDDVANAVSQPVGGFNGNGEPRRAFLMEIPLEIAEELDQEKSLSKVARIEQSIRAGTIGISDPRNMRIPDGITNQIK